MKQEYAIVSVKDGRFHKPVSSNDNRKPWEPTLMKCGRTLVPQNYFVTEADANNYTGGRLEKYICKHCVKQ